MPSVFAVAVIGGLVPAIPIPMARHCHNCRDARHKAGHDALGAPTHVTSAFASSTNVSRKFAEVRDVPNSEVYPAVIVEDPPTYPHVVGAFPQHIPGE
jgi:hypothetical protein